MKKFKELKENELFTLESGSEKMYRLQAVLTAFDGTSYYLTRRAYGNGNTGFWSTSGEKEVFEVE
jgi:hypothetical protein